MLAAGAMTVGFKIYEQVKNGEKVDIGKAVGHLASGEFLGGYGGAAIGATAGTVIGHLSSGIPVVGPFLGAFTPVLFGHIGGYLGARLGDGIASGRRPSLKEAWRSMDKGQMVAQSLGSLIGFTIGNLIVPGLGGMVGGVIGSIAGGKVLDLIRGVKDKKSVSAAVPGAGVISIKDRKPTKNYGRGHVVSPGGITSTGRCGNDASRYRMRMEAAYKRYSALLAHGKGESSEAMRALNEYKEAYAEYQRLVMGGRRK